jgi:hypothetical protein
MRAPGFDGAAGSAKLRKNADRATLLHVTILQGIERDRGRRASGYTRQARPQPLARAAKDVAHHFDLCDKPSPLAESSTGVTTDG